MKNQAGQIFTFGPYEYDIDKAMKIIASQPEREIHHVSVAEWSRALGLEKSDAERKAEFKAAGRGSFPILRGEVDEDYARTKADLSVPLIFADLASSGEAGYMLIDGTHRMRRAVVEGVETVQVYLLDRDEVQKIRTHVYIR